MELAGCVNDTKPSYMLKHKGKFHFLCHDPFKNMPIKYRDCDILLNIYAYR